MNIKKMMRQAQQMQEQMKQQLEEMEVTGTSGGGMVAVTMAGTKEIRSIKIKPEVVDPAEVEMLEDLIMAAVREAQGKVGEQTQEIMGSLMGGLKIPGL